MDLDLLRQKLMKAGRLQPPREAVPYAFEKRIMARLAAPALDAWALWSRGLWRAVVPCLAIMVLCGLWTHWFVDPPYPGDLSADLELTVLSPAEPEWEALW